MTITKIYSISEYHTTNRNERIKLDTNIMRLDPESSKSRYISHTLRKQGRPNLTDSLGVAEVILLVDLLLPPPLHLLLPPPLHLAPALVLEKVPSEGS